MTDIAQQDILKLQETIRSLQIDNIAIENSYTDELKKTHNLKRQIILLNSEIEVLKKQLEEKGNASNEQ